MSEDEMRKTEHEEPEDDDVEGHRRAVAANEEPAAEGEDDDVEGHRIAKA